MSRNGTFSFRALTLLLPILAFQALALHPMVHAGEEQGLLCDLCEVVMGGSELDAVPPSGQAVEKSPESADQLAPVALVPGDLIDGRLGTHALKQRPPPVS